MKAVVGRRGLDRVAKWRSPLGLSDMEGKEKLRAFSEKAGEDNLHKLHVFIYVLFTHLRRFLY